MKPTRKFELDPSPMLVCMSALGQKQTYAVQNVMSASPPKATAKADSGNPESGHVRCG